MNPVDNRKDTKDTGEEAWVSLCPVAYVPNGPDYTSHGGDTLAAALDLYKEGEHKRQDDDNGENQEDDLRRRGALDLLVVGFVL